MPTKNLTRTQERAYLKAREVAVSSAQLKRAQKRLQAARRAHDQVKDLPDGQVNILE